MSITACIHSNTDFWFDVTSVNFNSQNVHEDKIFEQQDVLQFLLQGSKYYEYISNSLIIHEENTKEINTETEFGYAMKHLHKIKPNFISIFSLNTDLFEMLDQTLGRVFHQDIQTPRSC